MSFDVQECPFPAGNGLFSDRYWTYLQNAHCVGISPAAPNRLTVCPHDEREDVPRRVCWAKYSKIGLVFAAIVGRNGPFVVFGPRLLFQRRRYSYSDTVASIRKEKLSLSILSV